MKVHRHSALAIGVLLSLASAPSRSAPCASVQGFWADGQGDYFNLTQNQSGQISGYAFSPYVSCPTYAVSGTMQSTGHWDYTATPQGSYDPQSCPISMHAAGTISKPGCHIAPFTWQSFYQGYQTGGNRTMSKFCDKPTSESSSPDGWSAAGTTFIWAVTLSPTTINFGGRTIQEDVAGQTTDHCHFTGSDIPYQTGVNAAPAEVNILNQYNDDVGWLPSAVTYYRAQNRAPCSFSTTQRMYIDCATGPVSYIVNGLGAEIGVTTVSSSRQGQTQSRTWP